MKRSAIVIAPGRGTYNKPELGYLTRHHAAKTDLLTGFDTYRTAQGQPTLAALDQADRFDGKLHTRGDHASPLILACAYADFMDIDRDAFDILAVTGNSMGWYIAQACAGALPGLAGMEVTNTMGRLMHDHGIGGQIVYPFTDENWNPIHGRRAQIEAKLAQIDARPNHRLALSINLGGLLVLAGDTAGLSAFEAEMPVLDRFPMRLPNHAAFHTDLQAPVSALGRAALPQSLFAQPTLPLIDGRGGIWHPYATDTHALRDYTLGHQVTEPYDFTAAIRTAAREFCPDVFIVLGPGTTLGGAVAQSLTACGWRGATEKAAFKALQAETPRLIAMGDDTQRLHATKGTP